MDQLWPALQRRSPESPFPDRDPLGSVHSLGLAVGHDRRRPAHRKAVLVRQEDDPALDVVERDQSAQERCEHGVRLTSGKRRTGPGAGAARDRGRRRGRVPGLPVGNLRVRLDLLALHGQRHCLRTAGRPELRHRVADVRADGLRREHEALGDLGAAHSTREQPEDLALTRGQGAPGDAPGPGSNVAIVRRHPGSTLTSASGSVLVLGHSLSLAAPLVRELSRLRG